MTYAKSKILVIGNSFAAAVREAIPIDDTNVSFVAVSGGVLHEIELDNNKDWIKLGGKSAESDLQRRLWQLTSGSEGPVCLTGFDAYVVIGAISPPNPWFPTNLQSTSQALPEVMAHQAPVSFGLYSQFSECSQNLERAKRWVDIIRQNGPDRKVFLVPKPYLMEGCEDLSEKFEALKWDLWEKLSETEKEVLQRNEGAIYERLVNLSGGSVILPPEETVTDGNRCPKEFSQDALGSDNFEPGLPPAWGDPERNMQMYLSHKNKKYGAIIWDTVLRRVQNE